MSFWYLQLSQKTNEKIRLYYYGTSSRIVLVRFLGELKTPKRHFEMNWPLVLAAWSIYILWISFIFNNFYEQYLVYINRIILFHKLKFTKRDSSPQALYTKALDIKAILNFSLGWAAVSLDFWHTLLAYWCLVLGFYVAKEVKPIIALWPH